MASGIDITGLTKNPLEVEEIGKFIVEKTFKDPVLNSIHTIYTGLKMKEQIVFAGQLGLTGIADSSCTRPNSGAKATLTQKYWEPVNVGDTLVHCQKDVDALFKAYYSKITEYSQKFNIEGSELEKLFSVMLSEAAMKAVWRLAWLGNKEVAGAGANTAGLKNATTYAKFFNLVDGLWDQIFTAKTAGDITAYFEITENAQDTIAAQTALGDGESITIFEGLWAKADSRLRSDSTAKLLVSRGIFDNYRKYLQGKGENSTIAYTMDGFPMLKWNGLEVINMETVWDLALQAYFTNNTTNNAYFLPNRVVLTTPSNIPIGTLNEGDMTSLEAFYDQKERQMYMGYGFTLDAKMLEPYMIAVAY